MKIPQFTKRLGLLYTKICDVSEIQTNLIQRKIRKKRQTKRSLIYSCMIKNKFILFVSCLSA